MTKLFGTDGIRGEAGCFPLDEKTVCAIGLALAEFAGTQGAGRILIARDTRESGPWIADRLSRGLACRGVSALHDLGVMPTAGLAYLTRARGYDLGIMISASHNPYRDNGIKLFSGDGFKISDDREIEIERSIESWRTAPAVSARHGPAGLEKRESLASEYLDFLSRLAGTRLEPLRVGLDVCNGAAYLLAPRLFRRLGAEVTVINDRPDGRNINRDCGSLHLEGLTRAVKDNSLDLGVAFDGDADRALFITGSGKCLDGDHTLYALSRHWKADGTLAGGRVVGTIMSNLALEKALIREGIPLIRTPVGDKHVLQAMQATGAVLGGEPSGHMILSDLHTTGDGLLTAVKLAELLVGRGASLDDLVAGYRPFPQVLDGLRVSRRVPIDQSPELSRLIGDAQAQLSDSGRMVVRYSGTEPLLRIMAEGRELALVQATVDKLKHEASQFFDSLE
ncbi:MAG: phosphoglucosamine mutase [Acidobacteria bacterium]|nr:phosphoglucosamine mutase [Acidobacteriota bacterium]MYC82204.1 phosphoglucosamine mutase [Acidobacteriota bacterium]